MLPRLLLVVGLSVGVMLPLIWAAFSPVPGLREASEPAVDPVHAGSADWREHLIPEVAERSISTARSNGTTIGTAPHGEVEAAATRSDDLPPARLPDPPLTKPNPPRIHDKEVLAEPQISEEAKPLAAETKPPAEEAKSLPVVEAKPLPAENRTPTVKAEKAPEVKEMPSASRASRGSKARARANGAGWRPKMDRNKPTDRPGWIEVMREAGWLEPRRQR